MKAKRVAIVYLKGFMDNIASRQLAFNKVVNDLISEGRVVKTSTQTMTIFEDGTKVTLVPFGANLVGMRITHLYVEDTVVNLSNGKKMFQEILLPMVMPEANYIHFEVEGSIKSRTVVFGLEDGNFKTRNLGE
jgi:hypothetical protein